LPPDNGLKPEIAQIMENPEMFRLPNKPAMTSDKLRSTVEALARQYTAALQLEGDRIKTLLEIDSLFKTDKKDDDWIKKVESVFEKAPQEVAYELMKNLQHLPDGIRGDLESQAMEILRTTERKKLTESEELNPTLYKETKDLEKQFSRKSFQKTGTKTVFLGGTLRNNAILRIIPNQAFVSWVKAYSAVKDWKEAGFDYVPIEPILKAGLSEDGKNTRVYAGVLGVSVAAYLRMYSTKEHHDSVRQQVETTRKTLQKMNIAHGHDYHDDNFCVLHNRTAEGEIDWTVPPRVYCIDFDRAVVADSPSS
jgi:hypothetical protein